MLRINKERQWIEGQQRRKLNPKEPKSRLFKGKRHTATTKRATADDFKNLIRPSKWLKISYVKPISNDRGT